MSHGAGASFRVSIAGACLAASLASAAMAQQVEWRRDGNWTFGEFGTSIDWIGDLDGDGVDDLAVGSPGFDRVELVSGATFVSWRTIEGEAGSRFGAAVAAAGDLDGDGVGDLWIGAPATAGQRGALLCCSSRDGTKLLEVDGPEPYACFGATLAVLDDIDGDGVGEVVVGAPDDTRYYWDMGVPAGSITMIASRDGAVIAKQYGNWSFSSFGRNVTRWDDLDGDGLAEVVTAATLEVPGKLGPSRFEPVLAVWSGRDLALLRKTRIGGGSFSAIYFACAAVADVDGDGWRDLLVGGWNRGFGGSAWLLSGRDGTALLQWRDDDSLLGEGFGDAGDVNGDGRADLAIGAVTGDWIGPSYAAVEIRSGADGRLLRELPSGYGRSIEPGGAIPFRFVAPRDLDGDGRPEFVEGNPTVDVLRAWSLPDETVVRSRFGESRRMVLRGATGGEDLDRDGIGDVACLEALVVLHPGDPPVNAVAWRSGRDGELLSRFEVDTGNSEWSGDLSLVPDLDGDGLADLLLAEPTRVALRSSQDGRLLVQWVRTWIRSFGTSYAGAFDGALQTVVVAIGEPDSRRGGVSLFDAKSGARLWRVESPHRGGKLGRSLCALGDIDGDGRVDFAAGADDSGGVVALLSGADGSVLGQIAPANPSQTFAASLAPLRDIDGDGRDELLIGEPVGGPIGAGQVHVVLGGSWTTAYVVGGTTPLGSLGHAIAALPDLNGDGIDDFAASSPTTHRVKLFSGANGAWLTSLVDDGDSDTFALTLGVTSGIRSASDGVPRAALICVNRDRFDGIGHKVGAATLYSLDDLFLQVDRPVAEAGESVSGNLRGGVPGAACGIYLVALDGVPFEQFLDFGVLDASGHFFTTDVVPPGLAGTTYRVRGYSVGFDGSVTDTRDWEIRFE